jgi:hypothetical protein
MTTVNELLVKSGRPAWDGIVPPRDQYDVYIKKYRLGSDHSTAGPSSSTPTGALPPKQSRFLIKVQDRMDKCCGVTKNTNVSDACFRFTFFVCLELHTAKIDCLFEGEHEVDNDEDDGCYTVQAAWSVVEARGRLRDSPRPS